MVSTAASYHFLLPLPSVQRPYTKQDCLYFHLLFTHAILLNVPDSDHTELKNYVNRILSHIQSQHPFLFDENDFYMLLTGIPKRVYTNHYGVHRLEYLHFISDHIVPLMEKLVRETNLPHCRGNITLYS